MWLAGAGAGVLSVLSPHLFSGGQVYEHVFSLLGQRDSYASVALDSWA